MKRLLAFVLLTAIVTSVFPTAALAVTDESDILEQGSCGISADYVLYTDGSLVITGSGRIADYAFYDYNENSGKPIKSVEMADTITEIGVFSFGNCYSLKDIDFSTGLKEIDYGAFSECKSIEKAIIPYGVTILGHSVFDSCSSLSKLIIPETVTTIGGRNLYACNNIKTAGPVGSGCDFEFGWSVSIPPYAFAGLHSITDIILPDGITSIGEYAFESCELLETITLPDSLAELGNAAFMCCYSLKDVKIPSNVTLLERTFKYCTSLENIVVPDSVTYMHNTFDECSSLKNVTLSQNLNYIGESTFGGCSSLENITIPSKVKILDRYAFKDCYNLKTINIPVSLTTVSDFAFENCTNLADVYYSGTESQWNNISVGVYNEYLLNADVHCSDVPPVQNTTEILRIKGKTRYETSIAIADATKEKLGAEKFDTVIIASGTGFADALAGSYLAKVKNAPILMAKTDGDNDAQLKNYVQANLSAGGTVYILGGTASVKQNTEDALKTVQGINVRRLKGKTRYDTNIAILEEAGVAGTELIVATGTNFADSLSASAVGKPILLVDGKGAGLNNSQQAFLNTLNIHNIYILGGTGAVNESFESQLSAYGNVQRVKGSTRYETSVAIAEKFFTGPQSAVLTYGENFPDGLCGGPLALSMDAPLVLTRPGKENTAKTYMLKKSIENGAVLGGASLIDDATAMDIFSADKVVVW